LDTHSGWDHAIAVGKNIKKLNNAKDWRAAAFWLERNVHEFAPKRVATSVINQVVVNEKPAFQMDAETIKELSAAYDARHGKKDVPRNIEVHV
jgi:hypothetical protein